MNSHTSEEIAEIILPQFDGTDIKTIETIVERYRLQDTWKEDLVFEESSFDLLQDILIEGEQLKEKVPYEDLVTTKYAEAVK